MSVISFSSSSPSSVESQSLLSTQTYRSTAIVANEPLDKQGQFNYEAARRYFPAQIIVDMRALTQNMKRLVAETKKYNPQAQVLGVVKADGYGHGLIASALAALAGGATWLGTAKVSEALLLRQAGIGPDRAHILGWMSSALDAPYEELILNNIDLGIGSFDAIHAACQAAQQCHTKARLHIAVDTGFGRNGFTPAEFDQVLSLLQDGTQRGLLDIVGLYSHLAVADAPQNQEFVQCTDQQIESFNQFVDRMTAVGLKPQIRHLANTAATFSRPDIHFELVRPGNGFYGYEADPAMGTPADFGLVPAMSLQAQLGTIKTLPAHHAISYGRTYITDQETSIAIVPLGYADGIQRSASGSNELGSLHCDHQGGPVRVMTAQGPRLCTVSGRICMDQFLIDLHGLASDLQVKEGDTVQLFAPGRGAKYCEPTADDWAESADTINYVIYTCLRNRIPRLYVHAKEVLSENDLQLLDQRSILS